MEILAVIYLPLQLEEIVAIFNLFVKWKGEISDFRHFKDFSEIYLKYVKSSIICMDMFWEIMKCF